MLLADATDLNPPQTTLVYSINAAAAASRTPTPTPLVAS